MNASNFVQKRETLGRDLDDSTEGTFDIAFGVDANFVPPTGIALTSIALNNPDRDFRVHLFYNSIEDEDSARLRKFVGQHPNFRLELYRIDPGAFDGLNVEKGYTKATYNRILIAQFLHPNVKRLLYLDADTLCVGRLTELEKISFGEKILFAVPDQGQQWLVEHRRNLGFARDEVYYNSGVLYIDLARWNERELSKRMLQLLRERYLSMQDQDALNLIARRSIGELPVRFNQFVLLKEAPQPIPSDSIILHFAGQLKPWQPWCNDPRRELYDEYRARSQWREFDYRPRDYQEQRLMGAAMRRRGQWGAAMKFYFRYVLCKFRR